MHEADPTLYQPRLTRWSHIWRLGLCLVITAMAWGPVSGPQWREARAFFWLDLAIGASCFVLVHFRRRWPFPIAAILTLAAIGSSSSAGPGLLAVVSLATRRVWWQLFAVGVLGVVVSQVFYTYQPQPVDSSWWLNLGFGIAFAAAAIALGMYIGSRRELLWTLRDRAERAEAEQSLRVAQAQSNERARIAREMHDVLAHRISLVTMHAGALAYRNDLSPDEVKASAEIIQAKAHEALIDLRQVLGVLRGDGTPGADRPQPTYADIPALVDEAREAGMRVDLDAVLGEGMPELVGRTAYRVVQEGLTNARKHAPHAHARVTLASKEGGVTITVWNATTIGHRTATPGAGMGLVGLSERVQLAGGRLEHSSDANGFTLHAWIPLGDPHATLGP
ncbi:MAG TPA: histidine kinase [Nocardioidaceae bacterium]|nr:histidine kinase [Nocardioidaceae bacterium]